MLYNLVIMASEIRRTPVLQGESAQSFNEHIKEVKTNITSKKVHSAIERAERILKQLKKK